MVGPLKTRCPDCGASVEVIFMKLVEHKHVPKEGTGELITCPGSLQRKVEGTCWHCGKPCYVGDDNVAMGTIEGGPSGTDVNGDALAWESDILIHEMPCMKKAFPAKYKKLKGR